MFALICMCGGLGAVTRFVLNTSIQRWWNRAFPLSTFIINVLATFFAGVAAAAYFYQTADHSSYLAVRHRLPRRFLYVFHGYQRDGVARPQRQIRRGRRVLHDDRAGAGGVCGAGLGADRAGAVARLRWSGSQNSQIQNDVVGKSGFCFVSASFESVVLYTIRRTVIL